MVTCFTKNTFATAIHGVVHLATVDVDYGMVDQLGMFVSHANAAVLTTAVNSVENVGSFIDVNLCVRRISEVLEFLGKIAVGIWHTS